MKSLGTGTQKRSELMVFVYESGPDVANILRAMTKKYKIYGAVFINLSVLYGIRYYITLIATDIIYIIHYPSKNYVYKDAYMCVCVI